MPGKIGRPTEQRIHILRNQASELLWFGKLETTLERAKEVRKIAEKMLTLGIRAYEDTVTVTKYKKNSKGDKVGVEFKNDGAKKLAARRRMMSVLRDIQEPQLDKESKSAYKERTREIKHPLIQKIFNEYAPKYAARNAGLENVTGGGYTRIVKLGARRGDAAETCIIELV